MECVEGVYRVMGVTTSMWNMIWWVCTIPFMHIINTMDVHEWSELYSHSMSWLLFYSITWKILYKIFTSNECQIFRVNICDWENLYYGLNRQLLFSMSTNITCSPYTADIVGYIVSGNIESSHKYIDFMLLFGLFAKHYYMGNYPWQ